MGTAILTGGRTAFTCHILNKYRALLTHVDPMENRKAYFKCKYCLFSKYFMYIILPKWIRET